MELIIEEDKFKQTFNCIKSIAQRNGYTLATNPYSEYSGSFIQNIPITGMKSWFSKSKYEHKILFDYLYANGCDYESILETREHEIKRVYKFYISNVAKNDYNDVVNLVNKLFKHIDNLNIIIHKDFKDKC